MILAFWISLAVILYTYAGYPILIAIAARIASRPWKRAAWPLDSSPAPISIVMAVHNGANMLSEQLKHLLTLEPALIREVIVVSDGSTDATAQILRETSDPRLRAFILPEQGGKCVAVNHGVAQASGEILLFVDIRPRVEAGALTSLLANFADPKVGCVAGELLLSQEGNDATTSAVSGLYWRYEQWIRNC